MLDVSNKSDDDAVHLDKLFNTYITSVGKERFHVCEARVNECKRIEKSGYIKLLQIQRS